MTASASLTSSAIRPRGALHVVLWIAQGLLALAFGMAGIMKTTKPMVELVQMMGWPGALPPALVRFIGLSELLAAVGLLLPAALRWKPIFTPLAASGLVVVMLLASVFHLSRGELQALPINLLLGALAAFVAWGRFRKVPIPPRS